MVQIIEKVHGEHLRDFWLVIFRLKAAKWVFREGNKCVFKAQGRA